MNRMKELDEARLVIAQEKLDELNQMLTSNEASMQTVILSILKVSFLTLERFGLKADVRITKISNSYQ